MAPALVLRRLRIRSIVGRARKVLGPFNPAHLGAVTLGRHSDSWKSHAVAVQMRDLARHQIDDPESIPPYRVLIESVEVLCRDFPLPSPARFLDFGCGTGHYSELLARYFPGRFSYLGCDYSPEMIAVARAEWPNAEFVTNDLFSNSLDLGYFDVVCASALVDILAEYDRALDILLEPAAPYVLLHRQRLTDSRSHAEVAKGYEGQTTYRSFLTRDDLEQAAARHQRDIVYSCHVEGDVHTLVFAPRRSGTRELSTSPDLRGR